ADGTLMMPSFHRPWLFGSLDPSNPNWSNAVGKYMTLRPRPLDQLLPGETGVQQDPASLQWVAVPTNRPIFPYPSDTTGDVKNRIGAPGGNDSIWIDAGYPVQQAADGTKFKPLVAFYIEDLDGKFNVNAGGNLMGIDATSGLSWHTSNRGLGKWE